MPRIRQGTSNLTESVLPCLASTAPHLNQIRREVAAIAIESAARGRFYEVQVPFRIAPTWASES